MSITDWRDERIDYIVGHLLDEQDRADWDQQRSIDLGIDSEYLADARLAADAVNRQQRAQDAELIEFDRRQQRHWLYLDGERDAS